jgi:hypothetical protein
MNLEFDYVPNKNSRIYPKETFDKAILEYMYKVDMKHSYGELDQPDSFETSLTKASHLIEEVNCRYKRLPRKKKKLMKKTGEYDTWRNMNRYVKLRIKILDTPAGTIAKGIIEAIGNDAIEMGMRGSGVTNPDGTIGNVTIHTWDLIQKHGKA